MQTEDGRSLAYVAQIAELNPIPGADLIEVASIKGWKSVVKKGDFKVGDWCIYFECDAILPKTEWSMFLQDKNKPDKPIRLRTVKLRGQLSQGLAIAFNTVFPNNTDIPLEVGTDVMERLGVTKYEPVIPAQLQGKIEGLRPWFVPKTDEERIQNIPEIVKEAAGIRLYRTVKMDGTSGSFFYNGRQIESVPSDVPCEEKRFGVCSRNLQITQDENNTYWRMAIKYELCNKLKAEFDKTGISYVVQGEICGPGIQKNTAELPEIQLFVFNVYDSTNTRYLNYDEFLSFCQRNDLPTVPIENDNVVLTGNETVDELLLLADGMYPNTNRLREGLVWRPVIEQNSPILEGHRLSFKTVSNKYLLKLGD